jgi:prophage regulatory protein
MHAEQCTPHAERLLRIRDVCALVGFSESQVYAWMRAGTFPASLRVTDSGCGSRWVASEVQQWIAERIASCPRVVPTTARRAS